MVNDVMYMGTNTDLTLSGSIWGNCPLAGLRTKRIKGTLLEFDFSSFNPTIPTTAGNWAADHGLEFMSSGTGALTVPALSAATASGVPVPGMTLGAASDNGNMSFRTVSCPFAMNRLSGQFWYEIRLKKSTIANTTFEIFAGLLEDITLTAIVPITTTAATLSDNNLVGIYSTESAGASGNSTYKANGVTAVTVQSAGFTFVADTFTNLGMRMTPSGDKDGSFIWSWYQDGVRLATSKQLPASGNGTDTPNDVALGLVFALRNAAGSSPGTCTIQSLRAAQVYG